MHDRHTNKRRYFNEQARTTREHVIPYLEQVMDISPGTRVFEIGCGEGGNLLPFLQRGCSGVGVDFNQTKITLGTTYLAEAAPTAEVSLLIQDIYDSSATALGTFDLIILRDVIEHIHDQGKFLRMVHRFLRPGGYIFFGFPPWRMPFGGHQQICRSPLLSKLPWFHLLPMPLYRGLLRALGETEQMVVNLAEIKDTGISIDRFSRLVRENGFVFTRKDLWLINPNYETKFGLQPRPLPAWAGRLPWIRDFYTTCCYAIIQPAKTPVNH